jgi:hypothetical protein
MLEESYRINRDLACPFGIAFDVGDLAAAAAAPRRSKLAARHVGRADALRAEIGRRVRPADAEINERTLAVLGAQLREDELASALQEGRSLGVYQAIVLALADVDSS